MEKELLVHAVAGAAGGTLGALACSPLDIARTRMQINPGVARLGLIRSLSHMYVFSSIDST